MYLFVYRCGICPRANRCIMFSNCSFDSFPSTFSSSRARLAVRMSLRQQQIGKAWSAKQRHRNFLDDCVFLVADHIKRVIEEHKRETFFWALSDDFLMVLDTLEQIASVADNLYVGRSSHPGVRMWGIACGLDPNSEVLARPEDEPTLSKVP